MDKLISFDISPSMLAELMQLPADAEVVGSMTNHDAVRVVVRLGAGEECIYPTHVSPSITKHRTEWDWGLPPEPVVEEAVPHDKVVW